MQFYVLTAQMVPNKFTYKKKSLCGGKVIRKLRIPSFASAKLHYTKKETVRVLLPSKNLYSSQGTRILGD